MAIVLYKKGNTTKVNGIPCQIQICEPDSYLHLLKEGWFYTPEEMLKAEKAAEKVAAQVKIATVQAKTEKKVRTQAKTKDKPKKEIVMNWDKESENVG